MGGSTHSPHQLLHASQPSLDAAQHIYVAYSGGLDSSVLLHSLCQLYPCHKITALHIHHGLSDYADDWQSHCQQNCTDLGVALKVFSVSLENHQTSVEAAARQARYACFDAEITAGSVLVMAHHLDDQVETLLFRMLRGAGVKGLASIPRQRTLGLGVLLRPLLTHTRKNLEDYARHYQLKWVEDESNQNTTFDRNYLRHQVVPAIAQRWPDYGQRIQRTVEQCQQADELLHERATDDLLALNARRERLGESLCLLGFNDLSPARQRNVLKTWMSRRSVTVGGYKAIEEVLVSLVDARQDSNPIVCWSGGQFRRFKQRLYLLPIDLNSSFNRLKNIQLIDTLSLASGASLGFKPAIGAKAIRLSKCDHVDIFFRVSKEHTDGEVTHVIIKKCRPATRRHGATLKKLLQEYSLEPWLRDAIPLIVVNGQLAAVGDLFVCAEFACNSDEMGWQPHWYY